MQLWLVQINTGVFILRGPLLTLATNSRCSHTHTNSDQVCLVHCSPAELSMILTHNKHSKCLLNKTNKQNYFVRCAEKLSLGQICY